MAKQKIPTLTGQFVHTIQDGQISHQGEILTQHAPGLYQVQWFSWVMGEPTNRVLVSVQEMVGWKFYETADQMNEAYRKQERRLKATERAALG